LRSANLIIYSLVRPTLFYLLLMLRPVDSTILFFQGDLVVVIILEYTRESRMWSIWLHF